MGAGSGQLGNAGETCDVRGPGHLARGAGGESPGSGRVFCIANRGFSILQRNAPEEKASVGPWLLPFHFHQTGKHLTLKTGQGIKKTGTTRKGWGAQMPRVGDLWLSAKAEVQAGMHALISKLIIH